MRQFFNDKIALCILTYPAAGLIVDPLRRLLHSQYITLSTQLEITCTKLILRLYLQ